MSMGELGKRVAAATQRRVERETQKAKSQRWQNYAAWATVVGMIVIAENPPLISCFRDVKCDPALTKQQQQQAEQTTIYIVDFYQYLYDQLESLNYIPKSGVFVFAHTPEASRTDENWVTWGETIYIGFQNSAMECKALAEGEDAYEWKFTHAVYVSGVCPSLPDPGSSPYPYP
jgi:hypothetical protein